MIIDTNKLYRLILALTMLIVSQGQEIMRKQALIIFQSSELDKVGLLFKDFGQLKLTPV